MPVQNYDVIVVGLGAMGSAAVYHLAQRGRAVLGLDRFAPPHALGSSHGQTRIIREAYFEHPSYVPIVQRAYELWSDLEAQSQKRLFWQTGGLMIGPSDGLVFNGAKRSAEQHHLRHEIMAADQIRERFPAFCPAANMMAVWEPRAGILFPEDCIAAHLKYAEKAGAQLRLNDVVLKWSKSGSGVDVCTSSGRYQASQLLISAGSWIRELVPDLNLPLKIERQVLYWFDASREQGNFRPGKCPVYIFEFERNRFFYGFPDLGSGVKVARHHEGPSCDPNKLDREIHEHETDEMRDILSRFLPDANGPFRSATVCMYTDTPDGHFIIDRHPETPQVLVASPCSGHGFKFSSAIGEILADLLTKGESRFDLHLFQLKRDNLRTGLTPA